MHSKGETAAATAGFCLLIWSSKEDDSGEEKKGKGPNDPESSFMQGRTVEWCDRDRVFGVVGRVFFVNSLTERRVFITTTR